MRSVVVVVVVVVLVGLMSPSAASAVPKTIEGRLVVVHIDDFSKPGFDYWLETSDKRVKLKIKSKPRIKPNARVRVEGDLKDDTLEVDSIQTMDPPPAIDTATRRDVLVMLVNWTAPDSLTSARAAGQVGDTDHAWFGEASYGLMGTDATATPWMTLTPQKCGDYYTLLSAAENAARARGFDPSAYDHRMVYFPRDSSCGWAGLGQIGGGVTWINGYMDTRVTVHELGHNLGLYHSDTLSCYDSQGAQVTLSADTSRCNYHEYGDDFDAMGASNHVGHFNAAQKHALNWLGGRVQTITADSTVSLTPFESGSGLKAAVIPTTTRSYWLEYRQAIGVDSFLSAFPGISDGVLIHSAGERPYEGPALLDARPDAFASFSDAALAAGMRWTAPDGVSVEVDTVTGAEARVTIRMPDRLAPTVTTTTPLGGATSVASQTNVTTQFSEPMDQASTQAAFSLSRTSDGATVPGASSWSGRTLSFDPTADLAPGTTYTARVGTGALDEAGNSLQTAHAWQFVTSGTSSSNLVKNPSFEADLTGWGTYQAAAQRVTLAGAPDGGSVAKVTRSTGTSYSLSQTNVATTTAGGTHIATAYIRGASTSAVGKPIKLTLRERTSSGAIVREVSSSATLTSGFARVSVPIDTSATGNVLSLRAEQFSAVSGDAFYVDLVGLVKASSVMGATSTGTVWTTLAPNIKRASVAPLRSTSPIDVSKLRAYVDGKAATSGSTLARGLIYTDAAGVPGKLLARSAEVSVTAGSGARWIDLRFSPLVRLAPGTYWLSLHAGGSTAARYGAVVKTGALRGNNDTYSDGATSTYGTTTVSDKEISLHAIGG